VWKLGVKSSFRPLSLSTRLIVPYAIAFLILSDPAILLWLAGCAVVYAGFLWFAELVLGDKTRPPR
jgi:hypothetical protein